MPSGTQFAYFGAFFGAGLLALALAVTVFLPVIIIAPAKFASAFTLGSALIMGSFFALKGFKAQLSHMLDKDRLLFSICESTCSAAVPIELAKEQRTVRAWVASRCACFPESTLL